MSNYAGTTLLARQGLRRDRVLVPIWVALLVVVCYASAAATPTLYDTVADRIHAAEAINANAAVVALYGPILDPSSVGELAMTKMTVLYAVFAAILFVVVVRRHTRVEEESGRLELVGGTAVGRAAPLSGAVLEGVVLAVALGALVALANVAGGLPVVGSIAFGASWTGIGLVTVGLTAVACQLSASARTCAAIAAAAIAVLYVLRAVGDASVSWLSWLSPFGWNTQLRAWSGTRWWILLLYVATATVLVVVASTLRARRDLGSGMLAERPGPAEGSPRLADALALCLQVHAAMLVLWTVAIASVGLVFGAIAPGVTDLLDSPDAADMIERLGGEGALEDALVAAVLTVVAIVVTCFAITIIGHAATDEADGRAEEVLATATSRARWFGATLVVALGGSVWLLLVGGISMALGYGGQVDRMVPAALAWTPAVWLVAALAAAGLALDHAWTVAGWALLALFVTLTMVGELLRAPQWLIDLSPYSRVPLMPSEPFAAAPEAALTCLAVAVLGAAWWRFRRRDIG